MSVTIPTFIPLPNSTTNEKKYGYEYVGNGETGTKTISFDFTYFQNGFTNDGHKKPIIRISRNTTFLNQNYVDDTLLGELVGNASTVLFPLDLEINMHGFFTRIENYKDIISKWEELKPNLFKLYDNESSINLIQRIDVLYRNTERLLKSLQNDWFFVTFFLPVYGKYGANRTSVIQYYFPISTDEKALFEVVLNLQDVQDETEKTVILVDGKSIENENDIMKGYVLLNEDRTIHETKLNFYLSDTKESIQVKIWEKTDEKFSEKE